MSSKFNDVNLDNNEITFLKVGLRKRLEILSLFSYVINSMAHIFCNYIKICLLLYIYYVHILDSVYTYKILYFYLKCNKLVTLIEGSSGKTT